MNWFGHYAFGSHAGEWLAIALVILLALLSGIALLTLVIWLLTPERDTDKSEDKSEKEYWRIHGG